MKSALKAWLFAACAVAGFGCTGGDKTQVVTGRLSDHNAIAVRAIDGTTIITAARVRSDGTFTLLLPKGHRYRLEVLTTDGVHNIAGTAKGELADLGFSVCEPQDPFDMGGMSPGCDPMTDPNCGGTPCDPMTDPNCTLPCMDPNSPDCKPPCDPTTDSTCTWPCMDAMDPSCEPPPPPCDPSTDPNCGMCTDPTTQNCWPPCDPMTDPNCQPPPPPCDPMTDPNCGGMCTDPTDPNCGGTCDPMTDPNCQPPPPCDPTTDPMCKCWPGDPDCPITCDPMTDPNCGTMCDPTVDAMCPTPPPPCEDPMDPNTCKDPCVVDPLACGCAMPDGTTNTMPGDENTCWPPPEPCTMQSCPDDPWWPTNPPPDFGCGDGTMVPPGDDNTMPGEDGTK